MPNYIENREQKTFRKSRVGLAAGILFLVSLLLWLRLPVTAAPPASPQNQTVPIPTATATRGFLPTATPTPGGEQDEEDDDDDDDEEEEEEESEPEVETQPEEDDTEFGIEFGEPTATPEGGEAAAGDGTDAATGEDATGTTGAETTEPVIERPTAEYTGTVLAVVLNVREIPSRSSDVQGTVFQDETVGILGRNVNNTWWLICCATGEVTPGWVPMDTVLPAFPFSESEELLAVMDGFEDFELTPIAEGDATLQLSMHHNPQFVWQDESFQIIYTVVNNSNAEAVDVELRNDFDAMLEILSTESESGEIQTEETETGTILTVNWESLEARSEVEVVVEVLVSPELADGAVVDNLAALGASNAAAVTAGVSVSMPPVSPPDFQ